MKPLPTQDLVEILDQTLPLWDQMRGRRIFLSGCTGFFGAWLLESLFFANRELDLNVNATVLSRNPGRFLERMPHLADASGLHFIEGDVRSFGPPDGEFEYLVHAATATTAEAAKQPMELLSTLVDGTKNMLGLARKCAAKRFLLVSSGAVYGKQPASLSHIPEDYRGGPDWLNSAAAYGEGKRVAEQMCSLSAIDSLIQFRIARCFAFVGPHLPLDQHFAIGNFIADALAGRNIDIQGDGTPMRSYLYAADLAVWLWTLLLADVPGDANPAVFNVGSSEAINIRGLAETVIEELNPALRVRMARESMPDAPLLQYVPNVEKADALLGLRPTISLREAIRRTAAWHQE